ncbi:hypothetical protein LCGC14_2125710, partial [marine sediment metagenome]
ILTARDRMAREAAFNRTVDAADRVRQGSVQFLVDESSKSGSDTEGNVERYDDFLEALIQEETADFPEELKLLTRRRLQAPRLKNRTGLAVHQQEQVRGETFFNLDKAADAAVQEVTNNPTLGNMQAELEDGAFLISEYKAGGFIDAEEAEARTDNLRQRVFTAAINSATLTDPEAAQALVDATKAVLPAETIKSLEADIRKQTKLQKDEAKAERDATAKTFINEIEDQALDGTVTQTQLQASPVWDILTTSEKNHLTSVAKDSSPFNTSDPVTLAEVTTLVNTDPTSITEDDFDAWHGRAVDGISTSDYNRLIKVWRTNIEEIEKGEATDPLQKGFEKQAYLLIDRMRKDTAFIDPGGFFTGQTPEELQENDLLAAQQVNSLARYIEEHPGEDYVETYIKPVLKPIQEGFVSGVYDRATAFFTDEPSIIIEEDIEIRRQAADLLTKSGVDITRENINRASAQIKAGNIELKILDAETARKLFDTASGTGEDKAANARREAIRLGFIIP